MTAASELAVLLDMCHNRLEVVAEAILEVIEDEPDNNVPRELGVAVGRVIAHAEDPTDAYSVLELVAQYYVDLTVVLAAALEACPNCFSDLDVCDCNDV